MSEKTPLDFSKYKLLIDQPIKESGVGAHNKLAYNITDSIKYSKITSIALYGEWGSGKSSVVNMVSNMLEADLIEFDLWHHSGDLLRRSFLGEIAEKIGISEEKYNINTYQHEQAGVLLKQIINGNYQNITTIDIPSDISKTQHIVLSIVLSWIGVYGALSEIFKVPDKLLPINFVVLILPIKFIAFIILGIVIYYILKFNKELARLFSRKTSLETNYKSTQTTSLQSNDLSDSQFIKIYEEIILEYINKSNKSYLICLDNLDRMSTEKASSVLDELNIFITKAEEIPNIYFIIPVDDHALARVIDSHNNSGDNHNKSSHFIQKLFPISFRLPDMLNFEWRGFFKKKLDEANFDEKDCDIIIKWFDKCRTTQLFEEIKKADTTEDVDKDKKEESRKNISLTPRDIIYYINKLITTGKEMHGLNVTIEDIALYTGIIQFNNKLKYDEYFSQIQEDKKVLFSGLSSENIENLYKIHYQTNTPYETLYKDKIISYIRGGEYSKLNEILKTMPDNINFLTSIIQDKKSGTLLEYTLLIKTIEQCFEEDKYQEIINNLSKELKDSLHSEIYKEWDNDNPNISNQDMYNPLVFLVKYCQKEELQDEINTFWEHLLYKYNNHNKEITDIINDRESYKGREYYFEFLKKININNKYIINNNYTSWFILNYLAYDTISDYQNIYDFYKDRTLKLINNIKSWMNPKENTNIMKENILTYSKAIPNIYEMYNNINITDNEKNTINNYIKDLICMIIEYIKLDITNYQEEILIILYESIFYLKKNNQIELINECIDEDFLNIQINPRVSSNINVLWEKSITNDKYNMLFKLLYILDDEKYNLTPNLVSIRSPHYPKLTLDILKDNKDELELSYTEIFNSLRIITDLYDHYIELIKNEYDISIDIWMELLNNNIDEYQKLLPKEALSDDKIRNILIKKLDEEVFIKLIKPIWEQEVEPTSDTEWKYFLEYASEEITYDILKSKYSSNLIKDYQQNIINILIKNISKINETSILYKTIEKIYDDFFSEGYFNDFYNDWKDFLTENNKSNIYKRWTQRVHNELSSDSETFIKQPQLLENAKLVELELNDKNINLFIKKLEGYKKNDINIDRVVSCLKEYNPKYKEKLQNKGLIDN